ncbi:MULTISPECIES: quinone-dependent dihydroorotate dehydrogenase [unclassified Streptomyces]|uniref:quinone-dependent dihydroorotate dehydrogenase n=1 Tax=unclassified Streptomyces TaxID=2593676 RepID=UPI00136FBFE8|nr:MULTISPECIES: quinone-dependent dihydroorotate dehydrogenase [unclassified Streptomyces]NEA05152.1 quinone-dependent dihydroorotate dehydrogenase [Streptomyces sp. SID10116]MYY85317.1 quinone-dependent dihydroorotate dehydrogenase [Streptomyces sp. SID335]MYZ19455.1 quinone-dependent dihydroorotate dehydrogenase [Streptomyces sp. SID337]NDZ90797.1 quinone-dependent dihydroorotate dehydrogenase [Streptomyces sp. SID10115]NEB49385.1 quinone-dependent dihydroorotate dehydrogenase [Streptomyces
MYKLFFHLVFKRMDPEQAHHMAFRWIRLAARIPVLRTLVAAVLAPRYKELRTEALGLRMHGPFGLAAGFDKNAVAIDGMSMLGFDHIEIGTVTGEPQPGNPKKRLFRLVPDRALINRMGFNNEGSAAVAERLATRTPVFKTVVGVNIGKTKVVPEEEAAADYVKSTERLARHADYLVVNVSSPNTPGLRNLQATESLRPLLTAVREAADRSVEGRRVPLLVKIAPDLADEDIDEVADLAVELGLDGIIATNTTIARESLGLASASALYGETGGLSGAPLKERSLEVLRRLYARVGDRITLVGVGGIENAEDAWQRILAGATLVQGYSAFIYEGPFWGRAVHKGLAARLRTSPYATLADAVGADVRKPEVTA